MSALGRFTVWRRATALAFLSLIAAGAHPAFHWFRGTATATEVVGFFRLTDPLAAIEVSLAARELHLSVVVGAALLLGLALLFGSVFCSWVCPLGLILDLNDALRRRVQRALRRGGGHGPVERRVPTALRYGVLGAVVGVALLSGLPTFQTVSPINMVAWAVSFSLGPGMILVAALLAIEWFVPRLWCRALCPTGALYSAVGARAPLRVRVDPALAGRTPCRRCTAGCPMGIPVMEEYALTGRESVDAAECTRCGSCVEGCPSGVLRLGFSRGSQKPVQDSRDPDRPATPATVDAPLSRSGRRREARRKEVAS